MGAPSRSRRAAVLVLRMSVMESWISGAEGQLMSVVS
jgi:hypothetical protein